MNIKFENGKFEFDDEFSKLAKIVAKEQEKQFQQAKNQTNHILKNNIKDKNLIEHTLDLLFEFLEDEEALLLYRKLCRHYWFIDKRATVDYIQFYVETYDPNHERFGNKNKNNNKAQIYSNSNSDLDKDER